MRSFYTAIIISLIFAFASYNAYAAPSYMGDPGPKEYVNRPVGLAGADYHVQTVTGTKKVVVILVDFPSAGNYTSGNYTMDATDISNIESWFTNFENYYAEASYGNLNLDVTFAVKSGTKSSISGLAVNECFTMSASMGWYGEDEYSYTYRIENLLKAAISTANVTSSDYHYVMVVHAGYGNESTVNSGDIWSLALGFGTAHNGFTGASIVPVRESSTRVPFGVICHEFGHQLGLPDIYAPDTGAARVGTYSLMDSGTWNDSGAAPAHPCSWSKIQLGWLTPSLISDVQNQTLKPYYISAVNSVYKFAVPGYSSEHFLLSYRKSGGFDSATSVNWGPVILHIDDTIGTYENNDVNAAYQPHPRVDIVGDSSWDASRVFTAPDSNSYSGDVSGITIFGMDVSGTDMLFSAAIAEFAAKAGFNENPVNFPNPARGSRTTISFKLCAPENDKTIRIYTPAGDLVKTIDNENITAVYAKDNEVVYQAPWDLNNDVEEGVASGIYIYLVEAGDKKKLGTLTVLR